MFNRYEGYLPPDKVPAGWRPVLIGAFKDVPSEVYFKAEGVNNSTLQHMRPTPAHCKAYMDGLRYEPPTPQMKLGTLIHHALLQGNREWPGISVKPVDMDMRTNGGKAWKKEQEAAGNTILNDDEFRAVLGCVESAVAHSLVSKIVEDSETEISCFTNERIQRKCRIDIVPHSGNALVDLKTCRDASPEAFSKSIANFGYHRQAAWYLDIWNTIFPEDQRSQWVLIAIENSPPYAVAIYSMNEHAIYLGRSENETDFERYYDCSEGNCWPGYVETIQEIDLPGWKYGGEL